ncbi:MAG: hypothetical protein IJP03_06710 [Christensenellaceae bacterium]|nr:hypothetical protein [Christensenellaceae bacterium]
MSHSFYKVRYTTIISNDSPFVWNYSCDELENILNTMLTGKTLKKVFSNLNGYLEGDGRTENYYDFSYMGGTILLVFSEDIALELDIHAEGMIAHRFHKVSGLTFQVAEDYPPDDMLLNDKYFFDLREEFALALPFEGTQILGVSVDGTSTYAFSAKGFDKKKATLAMNRNKLPSNIHFALDNGVKLSLLGDPIEYFNLALEKV